MYILLRYEGKTYAIDYNHFINNFLHNKLPVGTRFTSKLNNKLVITEDRLGRIIIIECKDIEKRCAEGELSLSSSKGTLVGYDYLCEIYGQVVHLDSLPEGFELIQFSNNLFICFNVKESIEAGIAKLIVSRGCLRK